MSRYSEESGLTRRERFLEKETQHLLRHVQHPRIPCGRPPGCLPIRRARKLQTLQYSRISHSPPRRGAPTDIATTSRSWRINFCALVESVGLLKAVCAIGMVPYVAVAVVSSSQVTRAYHIRSTARIFHP
jgi:hypothetical protein